MTIKHKLVTLVLIAAVVMLCGIILQHPVQPAEQTSRRTPVHVQISQVKTASQRFSIRSQGVLEAEVSARIAAEVAGKVLQATVQVGQFVQQNDVIARLDTEQTAAKLALAAAQIAAAEAELTESEAQAEVARHQLAGLTLKTSALALKQPQVKKAAASLAAARAQYNYLQTQLNKAEIRAPFAGLVIAKHAEPGDYVQTGDAFITLAATAKARIRVPLTPHQLTLLGQPDGILRQSIPATIIAEQAGQSFSRTGRLVRTEAAVAANEQLHYGIIELPDPYFLRKNDNAVNSLVFGSFVEVSLQGLQNFSVTAVPDKLLLNGRELIVVRDSRLEIRAVDVLHRSGELAYISQGLQDGEWIAATPLANPIPGMQVATEPTPLLATKAQQTAFAGTVQ